MAQTLALQAAARGEAPLPGRGGDDAEQEDGQEFLNKLLDWAHEDLVRLRAAGHGAAQAGSEREGAARNSSGGSGKQGQGDGDGGGGGGEWSCVSRKGRTAIQRGTEELGGGGPGTLPTAVAAIFGGATKSTLRVRGGLGGGGGGGLGGVVGGVGGVGGGASAPAALKPSVTVEPFTVLTLHVSAPSVRSLEDALDLWSSPEMIEGALFRLLLSLLFLSSSSSSRLSSFSAAGRPMLARRSLAAELRKTPTEKHPPKKHQL
jgi:hypothetical protein